MNIQKYVMGAVAAALLTGVFGNAALASGSYSGSVTDQNGASCKFWETGPNGGLLAMNKPHGKGYRGIGFTCKAHNGEAPYSCWYRSTENPHNQWPNYNKRQSRYYDAFAAAAASEATLCSAQELDVSSPGGATMERQLNNWSPV